MKECFFKYATETVVMYNFIDAFDDGCTRCTLSNNNKPILMRGNESAPIMLVGEAPGKVEEEQGAPFVGPAGELLDKILTSIDLDLEHDVLMTNACYCRPAAPDGSGRQNYTPKTEQIQICKPFTESLIRIVQPRAIIACGATALKQLSGDDSVRMKDWEGLWTCYTRFGEGRHNQDIPMFVITHPAAILHLGNGTTAQKEKKLQVWEYMKFFRDTWEKRKYEKNK